TNDEVVDEHVHAKKEKSDSKDSIHPHREPFEGQEGSVSLMVIPSHSLHDISIGEGEKRGLDGENDERKSCCPKLRNSEFCRCWGQPKVIKGRYEHHLFMFEFATKRKICMLNVFIAIYTALLHIFRLLGVMLACMHKGSVTWYDNFQFGASLMHVTGSLFGYLALLLHWEQRKGRYGVELACYVLRKKGKHVIFSAMIVRSATFVMTFTLNQLYVMHMIEFQYVFSWEQGFSGYGKLIFISDLQFGVDLILHMI
ncbi:hypothetical protein KI387_043722, partial [Taxus chinensis]